MANDMDFLRRPSPCPVVDPERIPAGRYYDEDFYALECERLWPRAWQMACRLEQIPNVGDWTEYSHTGRSVIVVRTRDGVRAYHNACRHRGVQLVAPGHGNCKAQGFVCPFHGWRWNLDGKNTFVYGRHLFSDAQLEPADLALAACRVEVWGGCAFINFDNEAPSYRETIGPLAERLDQYQVDKLRAEWWYATILPANWKIAMEAFMEGYHVMRTHPQLQAANPALFMAMYGRDTGGGAPVETRATARETVLAQFRQMELLSEGMAGMCHSKDIETARGLLDIELPDDPAEAMRAWYQQVKAEVFRQGQARGEPTPDLLALSASHPIKSVEFLFPNYFLLPYLSSFAAYRIRPLGPESCVFDIWSLTLFPEGEEPDVPLEPTMLPYDSDAFPPIPRQDYSNIPSQQRGLHAQGFEFMRLSKTIEGLISNYQRIIDGYIDAAPAAHLAEAIHALGGNFDGPIKDLPI